MNLCDKNKKNLKKMNLWEKHFWRMNLWKKQHNFWIMNFSEKNSGKWIPRKNIAVKTILESEYLWKKKKNSGKWITEKTPQNELNKLDHTVLEFHHKQLHSKSNVYLTWTEKWKKKNEFKIFSFAHILFFLTIYKTFLN